jgi:nonsense-mediated mRNA decay protein 3
VSQADQAKAEADYERFLRDLEEDPEMRQTIQLFRDPNAPEKAARDEDEMADDTDAEVDEDDEFPEIQVDELADELDAFGIKDDDGDEVIGGDDDEQPAAAAQ